jgi:hypothetical protein
MLSRILRFPLLAILLIAAGIWCSWPVAAQDIDSFDGTWEGKLELVHANEVVEGAPNKDVLIKGSDRYEQVKEFRKTPFKITIRGQRASIYWGDIESMPGLF